MDTEKIGEKIGYLLMFFVFSIILYFMLKILNKIPVSWSYFHVLILAFFIVLIGLLIKKVLK